MGGERGCGEVGLGWLSSGFMLEKAILWAWCCPFGATPRSSLMAMGKEWVGVHGVCWEGCGKSAHPEPHVSLRCPGGSV